MKMFEDIRNRMRITRDLKARDKEGWMQDIQDIGRLLVAVDALLGMLLFAGHKPWCTHCDCGYEEALDALPEHLRES